MERIEVREWVSWASREAYCIDTDQIGRKSLSLSHCLCFIFEAIFITVLFSEKL